MRPPFQPFLLVAATLAFGQVASGQESLESREIVGLPIAEVVQDFKNELRRVQNDRRGRCTYSFEKVHFDFVVIETDEATAGVEAGFKILGFGGKATAEAREMSRSTSTVEITYVPRQGGGAEEVAGSTLKGFGDLIIETKRQIEAAAALDDPLMVDGIVISTGFELVESQEGEVSVVVSAGLGQEDENRHHVTLTLGPSTGGRC